MRRELGLGRRMRARRAHRQVADDHDRRRAALDLRRQAENALTAAAQLEIDLGQKLGIEQRAVLDPVRVVDAEALAERIEAGALAGELPARDRDGCLLYTSDAADE